jgi:hypothetical protein
MRLFIELYLDEDVDVLIADLLRARGFSVLTTRDAGRLHATDEEQLAFAAAAPAGSRPSWTDLHAIFYESSH